MSLSFFTLPFHSPCTFLHIFTLYPCHISYLSSITYPFLPVTFPSFTFRHCFCSSFHCIFNFPQTSTFTTPLYLISLIIFHLLSILYLPLWSFFSMVLPPDIFFTPSHSPLSLTFHTLPASLPPLPRPLFPLVSVQESWTSARPIEIPALPSTKLPHTGFHIPIRLASHFLSPFIFLSALNAGLVPYRFLVVDVVLFFSPFSIEGVQIGYTPFL